MDIDAQSQMLAGVFAYLLPEIVLGVAACVLFLGGTFRQNRHVWSIFALLSLAGAAVATACTPAFLQATSDQTNTALFAGPLLMDHLALLVRLIALGAGIIFVLIGWSETPERNTADHHACLLLIVAGLSLTAAANDLITLFLALELISIPTYVLLYIPKHDEQAQEAALKYFLLSVFSSGLLLFGFSYLYGLTGTTNIPAIQHTLFATTVDDVPMTAAIAMMMIVAGLGFKITAVPFHFYAPDVYQGTAPAGAALLAFIPKVAGFVGLLRLLGFVLPDAVAAPANAFAGVGLSDQTPIVLWFLAAATMVVGNFMALQQNNIRRLLAYSSVAHAGYMLIALSVAPYLHGGDGIDGVQALLFYLVAYGAMTVGAFAVIGYLSTPERPVESLDDLAGLSQSHPGIALLMVVFLFSLIGIPLTAGFTGKLMVFFGAMSVPRLTAEAYAPLFRVLAVIGVVNAAIAGWYYLRIAAIMYLRPTVNPLEPKRRWSGLAAIWICAALTLGLSVPPASTWLLAKARLSADGLQTQKQESANR